MIVIKEQKGVTLIELMIALVIAAILVAGTYSLFISQERSYSSQDQIVTAQEDGRAALTIMARDIRMAGMLTGVNGFTNCTNQQVYGYSNAIFPQDNVNGTGPDQITVVYAADEFRSGSPPSPVYVNLTGVDGNQVTLSANIGTFFDTTTNNYVAFEGNQGVYQVQGVNASTLTLSSNPPSVIGNCMARVFRVRAITYSVNTANGTLVRNDGVTSQVIAGPIIASATNQSQVEDLQFRYQVQGDTIDWYDQPANPANITMVRIDICMRTSIPDPSGAQFTEPPLENHTTGLNGPDGFRRRVYTTAVKLRNFY